MAFARAALRLFLCAILVFLAGMVQAAAEEALTGTDLNLIGPPDLSSPRATLTTLRTSVEQAYDILKQAYDEQRADPGFFTSPDVSAKVHRVDLLLRRAVATLDLAQVPAVNRKAGHRIVEGTTGIASKLLSSVSIPVETSAPVLGHRIVTPPMRPLLAFGLNQRPLE
jgi:hypothetical protein